MLASDPDNTMVLFGLANEYQKTGDWQNAIGALEDYLAKADDEGAAYGMLARAYELTWMLERARAETSEHFLSSACSAGSPRFPAFRSRP